MNRALFGAFAALLVVFSDAGMAANAVLSDDDSPTELQDVKVEIDALRFKLEQLENKVNTPSSRPNLFNPAITAFGNFLTCFGQGGYPEFAHGLCDSPFTFREAEIDIRAAVDPWADAVLILAFEPTHAHDDSGASSDHEHEASFQAEIEEAYITLKKLPIINQAPWGVQLKAGRFRMPFGRFNQIHLHDLPHMTLPSSLQAFLGPHGLIRNGISAQIMIPTPGDHNSMNLIVQVVDGGGLPFDTIDHAHWPAALAHLSWFWDLSKGHDLEVGLSAYVEHKASNPSRPVQLYGIDLNYKWRPFLFGDKHSFLFGSEFYGAPIELNGKTVGGIGGFGFAQYQLNQWVYLGMRYDYRNLDERGHALSAYVTYYTTEFLRFRAGYEIVGGENFSQPKNNLLFEINFVFGSHPVEPYWVNR